MSIFSIYEKSLAHEGRHDMKKLSTSKAKQDIPELKREQLGTGIRGKYFKQFAENSNVVVLLPEIQPGRVGTFLCHADSNQGGQRVAHLAWLTGIEHE